ncbi:MAG: hypothetical protein KJO56_13060 [Gammaproteobacteria bacterium]|nr:hypothetical protein [Gammaproteobacteria bacterium]NNL63025.1 hypothetical protein [Woeseiaceae bacterium]
MLIRLLKSTGLVLVPMAALMVFGLPAFGLIWIVVIGLFVYSRFSRKSVFFTSWSWPHFLLTVGLGVGIPYALLLLSAGF